MLYMQKIAPRFRMPTIAELRKFIKENRDGTCAPYSKLKKAELLQRAIAAGYVVEDRPAAARKRRVKAKKPEAKKPEVSEVQTVKKKKGMKPHEIKSAEYVGEKFEWDSDDEQDHPPEDMIKRALESVGQKYYPFEQREMEKMVEDEYKQHPDDYYRQLWRKYKFIVETRAKKSKKKPEAVAEEVGEKTLSLMKSFNKKYNREAIKGRDLTKDEYTSPAFELMDKIKEAPKLSDKHKTTKTFKDYVDNATNFVNARGSAMTKTGEYETPEDKKPAEGWAGIKYWDGTGYLPNAMGTDTFNQFKAAWEKRGYKVVEKPEPEVKKPKGKKPEVKKPEVSEVQKVKKTKKMKPQEIKSEEEVIKKAGACEVPPDVDEALKRGHLRHFSNESIEKLKKAAEFLGEPFVYWDIAMKDKKGSEKLHKNDYYSDMRVKLHHLRIDMEMFCKLRQQYNDVFGQGALISWREFKKANPESAPSIPSAYYDIKQRELEEKKPSRGAEEGGAGEENNDAEIAKQLKPLMKEYNKKYNATARKRNFKTLPLKELREYARAASDLKEKIDNLLTSTSAGASEFYKKYGDKNLEKYMNNRRNFEEDLNDMTRKLRKKQQEEKKWESAMRRADEEFKGGPREETFPVVPKVVGKFEDWHRAYGPGEWSEERGDADYYGVPFEMWKNLSEEQKESVKNMREGEKTREEERRRAKLREAPPGLALRTAEAQERGLEDIDPIKERDSLDQSLHNVFNADWMKLTDQALPLYTEGGKGFKTVKKYYEHIRQKLEQGKSAKWIYDRYKDKFEDATGDILPWWGYTDMSLPPDEFYNSIMGDMDFYEETEEKPEEWEDDICRMKPLEIPKFDENQRFNKKQVEQIANVARSMGYNFVLWENSNEKRWGWKKGDYYRAMLEELPAFKYDVEMYCKLREEYNEVFGSDALRPWREYRLDHPNVPAKDYYRTIQRELEPYAMEPID